MAEIEISLIHDIAQIPAADWDACADPGGGSPPADPFTTHRFLHALEASGSVGPGTGWQPHHLIARAEGQMIAVAPTYLKSHSQGEYVFDHGWADAYDRAGGRYYPKLQVAVPFTPVTGPRLLCAEGFEQVGRQALMQALVQLGAQNDLSSAHLTFCTQAEAELGAKAGYLHRIGQQYHWQNAGYEGFDDFLAALSSRKRKAIRKERTAAQGFGGQIQQLTGDALTPAHWDAFWAFYTDTGARKWGQPYLTRAFFDQIHQTMRDDVLLVLAERDGTPVAGALNFIGRGALFGRYWGCVEHHPALHFELCYYQAIDWAIAHGLPRVEAGAQGDHKLARGYLPVPTHSLHWMRDPGLAEAVSAYLDAERAAISEDIEVLTAYGPFRQGIAD